MRKLIIIISAALACMSCSKWLDVQPQSQIKDTEMFTTESGFKEALAGVYTLLVKEDLYTNELRFGMLGVLAQEWESHNSTYNDDAMYDYDAAYPRNRILAIWRGMYTAIANDNKLLESIDDRKGVFTGVNYDVIKGEALALRAFIHFDLLRMFGANYQLQPTKASIPYVTAYSPKQTTQYTVYEVLMKCLADIDEALTYLQKDPILTGQEITELVDNGYLANRQLHLNYYAVLGLKARVCLYMGDYDNARQCAQAVIDSGKFSFTTQSDFLSGTDYTGATEQLFAISVAGQETIAETYFSMEGGSSVFSLSSAALLSLYENNTDDYRYLYLFTSGTGANIDRRYLAKYNTPSVEDTYYRDKMTMIKLSEMYYILAECQAEAKESTKDALNAVRKARGLNALSRDPSDFRTVMTAEFAKEFVGEGQLFFYYKRLNVPNVARSDKNLVESKAYIFPIPDSEVDAANREPNR